MNNAALDLASVMLEITRAKFCNNFHDIKKGENFLAQPNTFVFCNSDLQAAIRLKP